MHRLEARTAMARWWLALALAVALGGDVMGFSPLSPFASSRSSNLHARGLRKPSTVHRIRNAKMRPLMAASADTEAPSEDTVNTGFLRNFRKPLSSYHYSKFSGYLNAFREDPAGLLLAFSEDLESKGQPSVSLDFGL